MGQNYEAIDARQGGGEWHAPHDDVGSNQLQPGEYGIGLGGDEGVYVYGTVDQLREWLGRIDDAVSEIIEHAAKPLTMADIVLDSDGDYTCPRCHNVWFEPRSHDSLAELLNKVTDHIESVHRPKDTE